MRNLSKIILYIIIAITVVVMGVFYFGGGTDVTFSDAAEAEAFYQPSYTSLALNLAAILMGISVVAALWTAIKGFLQAPKDSMKSLLGLGVLVGVLVIAYLLSDTTPIQQSTGELFTDEFELKLADVCLYSTWILLLGTIVSIVINYVLKLTK